MLQLVYEPVDWVEEPMKVKRYELPLVPAGSGLLKSMGRVASSESLRDKPVILSPDVLTLLL